MIEFAAYWMGWFLIGWLGLLGILVANSMLHPKATRTGLLQTAGTGFVDAERIPLFMVTIGFAVYYVIQTIGLPLSELKKPDDGYWMPEVPQEFLYVLTGAQASFVTGKLIRTIRLNGG